MSLVMALVAGCSSGEDDGQGTNERADTGSGVLLAPEDSYFTEVFLDIDGESNTWTDGTLWTAEVTPPTPGACLSSSLLAFWSVGWGIGGQLYFHDLAAVAVLPEFPFEDGVIPVLVVDWNGQDLVFSGGEVSLVSSGANHTLSITSTSTCPLPSNGYYLDIDPLSCVEVALAEFTFTGNRGEMTLDEESEPGWQVDGSELCVFPELLF